MNRAIDVRTEMRRITSSKPLHAAAGAGVLASTALRELPSRIARLRPEVAVTTLPGRATSYVTTARARAVRSYDNLATHGQRVLNGKSTHSGKSALNGKSR
jgi:hypothetical protein